MLQQWKYRANELVEGLADHGLPIKVDKDKFYDILLSYDNDFGGEWTYFPITTMKNSPQISGDTQLSIDGIILNKRAKQVLWGLTNIMTYPQEPVQEKTRWQKLLQGFSPKSTYSTDETLKNLTNNEEIVSILMSEPAMPFSLLGNLVVKKTNKKCIYICTGPVLIKPGINKKDDLKVNDWEYRNINTDVVKRYFGRFPS